LKSTETQTRCVVDVERLDFSNFGSLKSTETSIWLDQMMHP